LGEVRTNRQTRKWQEKQPGADRYKTEIICDQMTMLTGKRRQSGTNTAASYERTRREEARPGPQF
jgi:single-strand DNA-binding protein